MLEITLCQMSSNNAQSNHAHTHTHTQETSVQYYNHYVHVCIYRAEYTKTNATVHVIYTCTST